jgi:PhoPQ-activated pathogenicity-related protein
LELLNPAVAFATASLILENPSMPLKIPVFVGIIKAFNSAPNE